jgi:hypothetical protein
MSSTLPRPGILSRNASGTRTKLRFDDCPEVDRQFELQCLEANLRVAIGKHSRALFCLPIFNASSMISSSDLTQNFVASYTSGAFRSFRKDFSSGIRIHPEKPFCRLGISAEVFNQLAGKIGDGGEYAAAITSRSIFSRSGLATTNSRE